MTMLDAMPSTDYPAVMSSRTLFSDQVRRAIRDAAITRYELSQRTGVDQSVLSRFIKGKSGISLDSLDLIAEVLDLRVVTKPAKRRKER